MDCGRKFGVDVSGGGGQAWAESSANMAHYSGPKLACQYLTAMAFEWLMGGEK